MSHGRLQDVAPAARPGHASVKRHSGVPFVNGIYREASYVTLRKPDFMCGMSAKLVVKLLLTTLVVCCTAKSSEDSLGEFLSENSQLRRTEYTTSDAGDTGIAKGWLLFPTVISAFLFWGAKRYDVSARISW